MSHAVTSGMEEKKTPAIAAKLLKPGKVNITMYKKASTEKNNKFTSNSFANVLMSSVFMIVYFKHKATLL